MFLVLSHQHAEALLLNGILMSAPEKTIGMLFKALLDCKTWVVNTTGRKGIQAAEMDVASFVMQFMTQQK